MLLCDPLRSMSKTFELQQRMAERRAMLRLEERFRKQRRRASGASGVSRANLVRSQSFGTTHVWHDVDAPKLMDLGPNREECLLFVNTLRDMLGTYKVNVRISFDETTQISSEALIYILGQIYRLQSKYGRHRLTGSYPRNRRIEHLLNESGFLNLLRVKRRPVAGKKTGRTRFLTYKTGNRLAVAEIAEIRQELFGADFAMPTEIKREVYRALSEAMANVGEHAYFSKQSISSELHGRWWMGASMSLDKNIFTLTFYDVGVGIPKTIPRKYNKELIRQILSVLPGFDPDDGAIIKAAVEIGRTRTNKEHRGKGLMDLHRIIDRSGAGVLRIMSRNGWYRYESSKDRSGATNGFLEGTLISWELPLNVATVQMNTISGPDQED